MEQTYKLPPPAPKTFIRRIEVFSERDDGHRTLLASVDSPANSTSFTVESSPYVEINCIDINAFDKVLKAHRIFPVTPEEIEEASQVLTPPVEPEVPPVPPLT